MSNTRAYVIKAKGSDKLEDTMLVEASNANQALRFVTKNAFEVSVASGKQVGELIRKGVAYRSVTDEDTAEVKEPEHVAAGEQPASVTL